DLASGIAKQINELNGGKPVSAIFLVGGGGKIPGFTDRLAAAAKLSKERVALRGDEVLGEIRFLESDIVKDSTLITPIGICLNYYEQNNNFVFVKCNGDLVKLYDNGRLTVMDAAAGVGFPNENLFPRRGKELEFSVNGQRRLIRGEPGESATVTVNGHAASVSSPIIRNDIIEIKESTAGPDAHARISDIAEAGRSITFYVNGKRIICPRLVYRGSECVTEGTEIRNGDDIKVLDYYTVDKLIEYMDVAREGTVLVNNIIALGNEKVYENFSVDFGIAAEEYRREEEPAKQPEAPVVKKNVNPITVIVNGLPVVLTGREKYKLVDVLDFYEFDTSGHSGNEAVIRVNGKPADFTAPVGENAQIELYWKK
ncbi:MAG: cell division protein FtsA, partial [Lachnospiraceae bacterium]|nr:cell division protein FtsA [Lachnospiraceae bacterium]